ncbi:MAG: hypothetical protein ABJA61_00035 [Caldimonas sp.]
MALLAALLAVLLGGCASTPPQTPIPLAATAVTAKSGRIGVAMNRLPVADTSFPGAGCLLCLAAASVANSGVTQHTKTLTYEDLVRLKQDAAASLRKNGADVIVIEEDVAFDALPDTRTKAPDVATKDFSALKAKYALDRLLVIEVNTLGFERTYQAYIPSSDPKAVFRGRGYIVNLTSNAYEWYVPVNIARSADGKWDEPPKFPGLTNAYYQTLELGRDALLKPLGN